MTIGIAGMIAGMIGIASKHSTVGVSEGTSTPSFPLKKEARFLFRMSESVIQPPQSKVQQSRECPTWAQAYLLEERLPLPQNRSLPDSPEAQKRALRRLQAWKTTRPFDRDSYFTQWLAQHHISEDEFLYLLAEPVEELYKRSETEPQWLHDLLEVLDTVPATERVSQWSREIAAIYPPAGLLLGLNPLLEYGLRQIEAVVENELRPRYAALPFDPEGMLRSFFRSVSERLFAQFNKVFVLEMHVERMQGLLKGATAEERYADFIRHLSTRERLLTLLEEYPVLARLMLVTLQQQSRYIGEFLSHLCKDWEQICATFTPGRDPGKLMRLQIGAGDMHREGRSVLKLEFSTDFKLIYKPKSLAVDEHFQQLLEWLNERGASPAFRSFTILDRGSYGWTEFMQAGPCASEAEIQRFYERQGGFLALLYSLTATDFHAENVIAVGEHPMLIDLEALFRPVVQGEFSDASGNDRTLYSVLNVGLLPNRTWSTKNSIGVDISGLGTPEGQLSPRPIVTWEGAGTDQMRVVHQRVEMPGSQNRPSLNGGKPVDALAYRDAILRGFTRMYQLLCSLREELITAWLPRFANDTIRVLLRQTETYARLLAESYHPDLLRDALVRERYFARLWLEAELRPELLHVIPAERRDLFRSDVPMFTTTPASRSIFSADGEEFPNFFEDTALSLVRQHLEHMGERDLHKQSWIVRASLATLHMASEHMLGVPFAEPEQQRQIEPERLLELSNELAERICELAICGKDQAHWLNISMLGEGVWNVVPSDIGLYDGLSGVALYLGYLGALTGNERYTEMAELAIGMMHRQLEHGRKYLRLLGLGAFNGLGSPIYLYAHLGMLWNEPKLFQEALELAALLPQILEKEDQADLTNGIAGTLMTLYALNAVVSEPALRDLAVQCGERLLTLAQPQDQGIGWLTRGHSRPLSGFAHGTAGIALSLLKLAAWSGESRFAEAAQEALAYERSLFVPQRQNWADVRDMANGQRDEPTCMVAWCHGAPGIGLGRMAMLAYSNDVQLQQEIEAAIQTTSREGMNFNHSLCHGAIGNVELLLMAAQQFREPRYREILDRAVARILANMEALGPLSGVPQGIETPGLMTGLAGIGYGLLRLARTEQIPSVLLLEPPMAARTV